MVNRYRKMRKTNRIVKNWLIENGFSFIYLVPHARWSKDIIIDNCRFDGFAFRKNEKIIYFLNLKTNKKISKKIINEYNITASKLGFKVLFFNYINRKGLEVYNNKI